MRTKYFLGVLLPFWITQQNTRTKDIHQFLKNVTEKQEHEKLQWNRLVNPVKDEYFSSHEIQIDDIMWGSDGIWWDLLELKRET